MEVLQFLIQSSESSVILPSRIWTIFFAKMDAVHRFQSC